MPRPRENEILLGLLEAVETSGGQSQRHLAAELGIALGLVNLTLKRCVKKGLIKVRHTPARRYAYYLTPSGFNEKSRLMADYLSQSLALFRRARSACALTLAEAQSRGWRRVAVCGTGDLADVHSMCAADSKLDLVSIDISAGSDTAYPVGCHPPREEASFRHLLAAASADCDGIIIVDLHRGTELRAAALSIFGANRVLMPSLVPLRLAVGSSLAGPEPAKEGKAS